MPIVNDSRLATVFFKDGELKRKSGRKFIDSSSDDCVRGRRQAILKVRDKKPTETKNYETVKLDKPMEGKRQKEPEYAAFMSLPFREQIKHLIHTQEFFRFIKKSKNAERLLENQSGTVRVFLGCFIALCGTKAIDSIDINGYVGIFCNLHKIGFADLYNILNTNDEERIRGQKPLYRVAKKISLGNTRYGIRFHDCLLCYDIQKFLFVDAYLPKPKSKKGRRRKSKKSELRMPLFVNAIPMTPIEKPMPEVILIKRNKPILNSHKP